MLILVEESLSDEKRSAQAEVSGFYEVHGIILCETFFPVIFYTIIIIIHDNVLSCTLTYARKQG
jgi:hypothetical protein